MVELSLALNGKNAEISTEFPVLLSTEGEISLVITNYEPSKKYSLNLNWYVFDFTYNKLVLDIRYLNNIESLYIVCDGKKYELNKDKLTPKQIINIQSGDRLNDLLLVLYNKIKDIDTRFKELEDKINSGDLLI